MEIETAITLLLLAIGLLGCAFLLIRAFKEVIGATEGVIYLAMWIVLLVTVLTSSIYYTIYEDISVYSIAIIGTILTICASSAIKQMTQWAASEFARGMLAKFLVNSTLILFTGAASACLSGVVRTTLYFKYSAQYDLSPGLRKASYRSNEAELRKVFDETELCGKVRGAFYQPGLMLRLQKIESAALIKDEDSFVATPYGASIPASMQIKLAIVETMADRVPISYARLSVTEGPLRCEFNNPIFDPNQPVPASKFATSIDKHIANLVAKTATLRSRPIGWRYLIAGGALKDLGLRDIDVLAKNSHAKRWELALWWFHKLFFSLLLAGLVTERRAIQPPSAGYVTIPAPRY